MRIFAYMTILATLTLAACGNARNGEAVDTCVNAITQKMNGKSFELDRSDMSARAKSEGTDMVNLTSSLILDKGLSTESKQTVECRVRFEPGKPASLQFMQFNWSNDDLKKARDTSG